MSFFSIILVLLIDEFRPLPYARFVADPLAAFARFLTEKCASAKANQSKFAWVIGIGSLVLFTGFIYWLLDFFHPILAWIFNLFILYLTLNFQHFNRYCVAIQGALRNDELESARRLINEWQGNLAPNTASLSATQIARLAIEKHVVDAYRHVFGVLVFYLLFGVCGAVFYRISVCFSHAFLAGKPSKNNSFADFSQHALTWIDALPARVCSASFAIVGNFEEALYQWRVATSQPEEGQRTSRAIKILLATAYGALSIDPEITVSDDDDKAAKSPDADDLESAANLVWRSLMLWLVILFVISLANAL